MAKATVVDGEREIILSLTDSEAWVIKTLVGRTFGVCAEVDAIYDCLRSINPQNLNAIMVYTSENNGNTIVESSTPK